MIGVFCWWGALFGLALAIIVRKLRRANRLPSPPVRQARRPSRAFAHDEFAAIDLPVAIELPDWAEWDRAVAEIERAYGGAVLSWES